MASQVCGLAGLAHVEAGAAGAEGFGLALADDDVGKRLALVVEDLDAARLCILACGVLQLEQSIAVLAGRLGLDRVGGGRAAITSARAFSA